MVLNKAMFFSTIGAGVCIYGCTYLLLVLLFDCDVRLGLLEKFGKSPRRLKGKVVFITGASSGIGEYTAYALAKHGVKLVLAARRHSELQKVKERCLALSKGQLEDKDILIIPMDLLDISMHKRHFDHALNHFGTIDILLNNAGRSQRAAFESIEYTVDKQIFELNVFSVVNLTRVALEHFNKKGEGHVAVVSSLAGFIGAPFSAGYCGSKHAIHGYFNGLRMEKLDKNIHVTLLCPGPIATPFLSQCFTGKDGEKYGQEVQPTDKKMSAERCGKLNAVALANQVKEAWIGIFPTTIYCYLLVYFPVVTDMLFKVVSPVKLMSQYRDSKNIQSQLEEVIIK